MESSPVLECILLVDDDDTANFLHRHVIQRAGVAHHVRTVNNGQEALDYLNREGPFAETTPEDTPFPNLILLDINMPVMNGWEFLRIYKTRPTKANEIKPQVVIMLTSALPEVWEKEAEANGFRPEDFVEKPLTKALLMEMVKTYFKEG